MGYDETSAGSFSMKEPQEESHLPFPVDVVVPGCDTWDLRLSWHPPWGSSQPGDWQSWEMERTSILGAVSKPLSQPRPALNIFISRCCISGLLKTVCGRISVTLQPKAYRSRTLFCRFHNVSFIEVPKDLEMLPMCPKQCILHYDTLGWRKKIW